MTETTDPALPTELEDEDNVRQLHAALDLREAVIVLKAELDNPDGLSRIIDEVEKIGGISMVWGWAAVGRSAQAVLAVTEIGHVDAEIEEVTKLFHDTYEKLAPQFSYTTREASAKPWAEVPEQNQNLMRATVATVLAALER